MKRPPRYRLVVVVFALSIVAAACSGGSGASVEPAGDPAPTTTFETFEGEAVTLASYAGRPVVVNFWASWCPSCVAEMSAAFLPAQELLGADVDFLGVNIQDERDKALELVEETGVLFDLAEDPDGALYQALGGLGMPFTVFISADGHIVNVHNGPLTEGQLVERITDVLLS